MPELNGPLRAAPRVGAVTAALALAGVTGCTAQPETAATVAEDQALQAECEPFAEIPMGKYWLNNNLWGQDAGEGTQCVEATYQEGETIGWRTDWEWDGEPYQVKSFVSSVLGWHWGWNAEEDTGLPVQLTSAEPLNTAWEYTIDTDGVAAVTYDLWLHDVAEPDWEDDPTDELMIWLSAHGGAGPLGEQVDTLTLAGEEWDLYQGAVEDDSTGEVLWNVYSFVHTSGTETFDADLAEFTGELVDRGELDAQKYLSSVQSGLEVFLGEGELETLSYSVTSE
jgi:hypothetical protein